MNEFRAISTAPRCPDCRHQEGWHDLDCSQRPIPATTEEQQLICRDPFAWRSLITVPAVALPYATRDMLDTLADLLPIEPMRDLEGFLGDRMVTMARWLSDARWSGLITSREHAVLKNDLAV